MGPVSPSSPPTPETGGIHRVELDLPNTLGLHIRAATKFVETARAFKSDLTVRKGGQQANGKSIMELLMLAAAKGSRLIIEASGEDAAAALAAIQGLIERKFEEE